MKVAADADERRVRDEMAEWAAAPHDDAWHELTELGLLHGSVDEIPLAHVAIGLLGAATHGLPGPVLEAELAVASGCEEAANAVGSGGVVTSVAPGPAGRAIVGWGSVASLVVDQSNGNVLLRGPLEPVETAHPMGHGVIERAAGNTDPLRVRRWTLGAALVTGLAKGALEMASTHAKQRVQFGRPLSSFQAVQFRLAETVHVLEASELLVLDAARRADTGDARADIAAALAWVYASDAGLLAEKQTHQVFGALGFAEETGLVRLTYQIAWLRTSIGVGEAFDFLDGRRVVADGTPPSNVLTGFGATGTT